MISFAPGLFSTITCCPQASVSFCPSARTRRSAGPPAVYGTTMRIGLDGYGCAWANDAANANASANNLMQPPKTKKSNKWGQISISGQSPKVIGESRNVDLTP